MRFNLNETNSNEAQGTAEHGTLLRLFRNDDELVLGTIQRERIIGRQIVFFLSGIEYQILC